MLHHQIKTLLRHLWRNRLFTELNVLGLAIGISSCWIIYRIVDHEFSYDAQLPDKENIYQLVSSFSRDSKMAGVGAPLYQGIRAEIPGVEAVPVFFQFVNQAESFRENKEVFVKEDPQYIVATDVSYFNMLPYTWLAGNKDKALTAPESVVLTESRAKEYFPRISLDDILGQTITYYGEDTVQRTVTGVVADFHQPSEFIAQEFFTLVERAYELYMWTNTNGSDKLYLQFRSDTDVQASLALINDLELRYYEALEQERGNEMKRGKTYELIPIDEVHFATHVGDYFGVTKTSKPVMRGLIGIGVFLLILACINYINMSTAQIPERAKEIGVRKTLGGSRKDLISRFLGETAITAFAASFLAAILSWLGFGLLSDIIPAGVTPQGEFHVYLVFTLGLVLLITLCAGLYPSWLITKVKTVSVLKNFNPTSLSTRFSLQKVLIVFQFFIALVFIISTIIVGTQLRYTLKADMGFNKDAIVLVNIPWKYERDPQYQNKQFTLLTELSNLPGVENVSLGTAPLSSGNSSSPFEYISKDENIEERQLAKKWIDTAYLEVYQLELLAGRNIYPSDTLSEYIINESTAKAFGFIDPQEAIGRFIGQRGNNKYPIVGVVKDFHTLDFYEPISPLVLMNEKFNMLTFNIKLDSQDPSRWQATLKNIQEKWDGFYPANAFQYSFYDETLQALYQQERQIARLINLATTITVLISCLGLFGMATLITFRRTKEIGIRKVMGASIAGIVALLSSEFVKLVCIAILIASPIAWWAMNNWLEDFAYRIEIKWWMFAVAGLAAVIIAVTTVSFQAIRVAVANPVKSLRSE